MKKWLSLVLAALMLLSALPAMAEQAEEPVTITIFHTNDVHGRYDSSTGMGYAMMSSYVNEARNAGENVLVLDAGDTTHGTIFANSTEGESIIQILNELKCDAFAVGNHDFNYGKDRLLTLSELANFPMLSANLLNEDGSYIFKPYTIIEIAGKKIAIVGAQNPDMKTAIHPDHIAGIDFAGVDQVQKAVDEVKDQADAVIILAHWGADDAYDPNSSVLAALDGVDLVIDGHSHTELQNIVQIEGNAPVTSTGEYLNNLGRVTLSFVGDVIEIEPTLIPNPQRFEDHAILSIVSEIEASQAEVLDTVIGKTDVDLVGEREIVRTQESNWGDFACDAFVQVTGADIALLNGGNIRKTVPAGDITIRNVNEVFPFANYIVVLNISGEQIKAMLEHGYSNLPETSGGFPQIGGMTVTVDISKPKGERVSDLMIGGAPVEPSKLYQLVTNDFLAAGGDGYEMLADLPMLLQMGIMDEMVTNIIREQGTIAPTTDGRINI
ncbi:bifunctional metallophosphatase/5'-nucleotidase, partial [Eubacteriales bacterium OttesenSCG-928-N13]|nr:bifunctional metallophosphatase/5'-nucleotidase [Eubacteriales bacterium OttesenSCG-928-N13]